MLARAPSTTITTGSTTNRGEGIASPTCGSSRATQGASPLQLKGVGLPPQPARLRRSPSRAENSPRLASRSGESVEDSQLLGVLHSKLRIRAPAHAAA